MNFERETMNLLLCGLQAPCQHRPKRPKTQSRGLLRNCKKNPKRPKAAKFIGPYKPPLHTTSHMLITFQQMWQA